MKRRNLKAILTPKTEVAKNNTYMYTQKTHRKPSEKLFPNRRSLSNPNLNKTMIHKVQTVNTKIRLQKKKKKKNGTTTAVSPWNEYKITGGVNRFYRRLTSSISFAVVRNT